MLCHHGSVTCQKRSKMCVDTFLEAVDVVLFLYCECCRCSAVAASLFGRLRSLPEHQQTKRSILAGKLHVEAET